MKPTFKLKPITVVNELDPTDTYTARSIIDIVIYTVVRDFFNRNAKRAKQAAEIGAEMYIKSKTKESILDLADFLGGIKDWNKFMALDVTSKLNKYRKSSEAQLW